MKPHPPAQTLDLTLLGCGADVVAALDPQHVHAHSCLNFCCPFEEDKGSGPCADKLWGKAVWSRVTGDIVLVPTANTNTIKVAEGKGTIKLCGSNSPEDSAACWLIDVDLARMAQGKPLCFPDAANANLCQKDKR